MKMADGKPINVDDATFESEVLRSATLVLVDFWAQWCGPCRMAGPVIEKIARDYAGKLKVCKLNVDDARQTATERGIMSIPTLHLYKSGKFVGQITSVTPNFESDIKKKIEPHLQQAAIGSE
jgi:thioredoxin 1